MPIIVDVGTVVVVGTVVTAGDHTLPVACRFTDINPHLNTAIAGLVQATGRTAAAKTTNRLVDQNIVDLVSRLAGDPGKFAELEVRRKLRHHHRPTLY